MFSGFSALWVGLKQQRTLSPAQTNRLNVTLIWNLNRIFLRFVNPKDFESFCREDGILVLKREKRKNSRNALSNGYIVRAKRERVPIYTTRNRSRLSCSRVPAPPNSDNRTAQGTIDTHIPWGLISMRYRHAGARASEIALIPRANSERVPTTAQFLENSVYNFLDLTVLFCELCFLVGRAPTGNGISRRASGPQIRT